MRAQLHLIDSAGTQVRASIQSAVEDAYRWTLRAFPLVDTALIANWAEDLACSMEVVAGELRNPRRYAAAALQGKVRDWLKTGAAKLEPVGVTRDLERLGGVVDDPQVALERSLLMERLKTTLSERDRFILVLLLDGLSDSEIATALGVSPAASRKAIQRMKERISMTLQRSRGTNGSGGSAAALCEAKG